MNRARRAYRQFGDLRFALYAIDGGLHLRVEILDAETQAIEPEPAQTLDLLGIDRARVHLDGKLVGVAVVHVE